MKIVYFACFLTIVAQAFGECTEGCDQPILFYESLGCKSIYTSTDDCCPTKFDCFHIVQRATEKRNVCYFHGKSYAVNEIVDDDETYGNCEVGCFCSGLTGNETREFICAEIDCAGYDENKPECHPKYEHGKCCPTAQICPPFVATCEVEGETYHEGQHFSTPSKKCVNCLCDKGFVGELEEPFCRKVTCIDEIRYQEEVHNFCAPSYSTIANCCPISWLCPDGNEIIKTVERSSNDPDLQCKFGDKLLNVGDKFEKKRSEGNDIACECRIPPYVTCFE